MLRAVVVLLLAVGSCAGQPPDGQPEVMNLFGVNYSVNRAMCIGAVAVGVGTVSVALPSILGAIGFGPIGIVGGSLAAMWQAYFGNVAAGSTFATLQSFAMTGAAPSLAAQALITSALASGCLVRVD